uniref:Hydin adenylate kinase-like domain-containing protein n=1 Tax=Echeneis naucrates TaxID=173247 RepID=A0A665UQV0_ECHNA
SVDMVLTGSSDSSKVVRERLVCHGIVGRQGCSELIMSVDVTCRFVAPMLNISPKQLNFCVQKVPGKNLTPLYEKLVLKNVSSLTLSMKLSVVEPFSLCEATGEYNSATTKSLVLGEGRQAELWVCFNPVCCQDCISHVMNEFLEVHYQGHPQQDMVELHAEVHFPNLQFSSTTVDFGCVLNCTETHRVITITNCSPLPVFYRWAFLEDQKCTHCSLSGKFSQIFCSYFVLHTGVKSSNKIKNSFGMILLQGVNVAILSTLLPKQVLVDILAERFQLSDCRRGIVIDGLKSVYTPSAASTLQVVLKAFNNRKHIYVVNLSDSYIALKAREKQTVKEQEEKKQQEEMKRMREEELKKKSKKVGKKDTKEVSKKKSLIEGKQVCKCPVQTLYCEPKCI